MINKVYKNNVVIISLLTLLLVISIQWNLSYKQEAEKIIKTGNLYPSIYVDGSLYYYTGEEIVLDGEKSEEKTVSKVVDITIKPAIEGEINLPYPETTYMKYKEDVAVKVDGTWILFKKEVEDPIDYYRYIQSIKEDSGLNLMAEQKESYYDFSQLAMNFLSEDEMKEIVKNQWKYTLTVNGEKIPQNGEITVKEGPISVKITESRVSYPVMAFDEYQKGAISGDSYTDHLDFMENVPDEEIVKDGTIVQGFTYIFGKEKPVENLEFKISEEMMVRLGLGTTVIKVSTEK